LPATLARITSEPARILGVASGRLAAGAPADLAIFDPSAPVRIAPEMLKSQGKNTPFLGYELSGRVRYTIVDGNVVYEA
jgi:dihydroorotase